MPKNMGFQHYCHPMRQKSDLEIFLPFLAQNDQKKHISEIEINIFK